MKLLIYMLTYGVAHAIKMTIADDDERPRLATAREFRNGRGKEHREMDCE